MCASFAATMAAERIKGSAQPKAPLPSRAAMLVRDSLPP